MDRTGAQRGCILLCNRKSHTPILVAGRQIDEGALQNPEFAACYESTILPVLESSEALVGSNARGAGSDTLRLKSAVRTILCAPIIRSGVVLGVLYVDSHIRARLLASEDLPPVVELARQASAILGA